jgi:hypothetical protein
MTDVANYDVLSDGGFAVILPSGTVAMVLTESEKTYMDDKIDRYMSDNHFTNIVDIAEVDKLVVWELLIHRWGMWVMKDQDYFGEEITVKSLVADMNTYATRVGVIKKQLGIDKVARDRAHGDDSIPSFWDSLKRRALEFAVMRSDQCNKIIESFMRVKGMLQLYDNCTDAERAENHCELSDVIEVLREEIIEFDKIDQVFRETKQKYWIRSQ